MIKQNIKFETDDVEFTDDAGQFSEISSLHALCWIHEIGHYKKLNPFLNQHHIVLGRFLKKVWNFYKLLKKYKEDTTEKRKIYVKQRFNLLFSTKTGYSELNHWIALTKENETELLRVPDYPTTPLHNVCSRNSGARGGNKEENQIWLELRGRADCMGEYALDTGHVSETAHQFLRICVRYILEQVFGCMGLSELVAGGVAESGVANSQR